MEYTTKKIEVTRGKVREQRARIARQRAKIEQAVADRHPADELQARLLIMEQSLIAMARFLRILERDLESDLGLHRHQSQRRIRAAKKPADPAEVDATLVLPPALSEALPAPVPDEAPTVPFDTVVKAMRKLTDR